MSFYSIKDIWHKNVCQNDALWPHKNSMLLYVCIWIKKKTKQIGQCIKKVVVQGAIVSIKAKFDLQTDYWGKGKKISRHIFKKKKFKKNSLYDKEANMN